MMASQKESKSKYVCSLCLSQKTRNIFSGQRAKTFICNDCSVVFNISLVDTNKLYNKEYFTKNYVSREKSENKKALAHFKLLRQFQRDGSLLDYGCGNGYFLQAAMKSPFKNNVGADVSRVGLDMMHVVTEGSVAVVNLNEEELPERRFEVVSFCDSLSATPNARNVLKNITSNYLSDEGVVFIVTPDISIFYIYFVWLLAKILPEDIVEKLFFAPQRYIVTNKKAVFWLLREMKLGIIYWHKERQQLQPICFKSFKAFIKSLLINARLLCQPSLVIVASRKIKSNAY